MEYVFKSNIEGDLRAKTLKRPQKTSKTPHRTHASGGPDIDYGAVRYILHIKCSTITISLLNKSLAHKQQRWKSYNSIDLFHTDGKSRDPGWAPGAEPLFSAKDSEEKPEESKCGVDPHMCGIGLCARAKRHPRPEIQPPLL